MLTRPNIRNAVVCRTFVKLVSHFGSHSKVANVGPADYNYDESISSLRYANRAKNIKNRAKINEDPKDALLRQFQKEIEELKKQLQDGEIPFYAKLSSYNMFRESLQTFFF